MGAHKGGKDTAARFVDGRAGNGPIRSSARLITAGGPTDRKGLGGSGRFALQRLRHAVDAAAGLGDLAHVDGRDLEAARLELSDERLA